MLGIRKEQMRMLLRGLVLSGLLTSWTGANAQQQADPGAEKSLPGKPVDAGSSASQEVKQPPQEEAPQTLHLLVGRSLVITSPTRIKRVSLADPDAAEAV